VIHAVADPEVEPSGDALASPRRRLGEDRIESNVEVFAGRADALEPDEMLPDHLEVPHFGLDRFGLDDPRVPGGREPARTASPPCVAVRRTLRGMQDVRAPTPGPARRPRSRSPHRPAPRLVLPDLERAERIGEFWSYPHSRAFAEPLIDCEEDRTLRRCSRDAA
jgi:hypothetical protein